MSPPLLLEKQVTAVAKRAFYYLHVAHKLSPSLNVADLIVLICSTVTSGLAGVTFYYYYFLKEKEPCSV